MHFFSSVTAVSFIFSALFMGTVALPTGDTNLQERNPAACRRESIGENGLATGKGHSELEAASCPY
ncbi:hypothetical protein DFP72DRAFT_1076239 [Ephemerocybe angulata]|uniref:Uncharacterized protein n=1 Tax=Ephemerocybe angulata TaxID=980116 RepID=A0A8H6HI04_9AGAR|nr:hypothetical protein DFP72DRAFT_1076239 [Tulosesus angulatus]